MAEHKHMPKGWTLQRSNDGKWRPVHPLGFHCLEWDSRSEAVEYARKLYNTIEKEKTRTWSDVPTTEEQ